ncbi:MAG: hypothetical protein ACQKBU_05000 [Verrucomicrobiales bacterium]
MSFSRGSVEDLLTSGMIRVLKALGYFVIVASSAAQESHFPEFEWKEKETEHFILRANGTNHSPTNRLAEKVWEVCVEVLPGLEADFAQNEFLTPTGEKGVEEGPFRYCVYLLGEAQEFSHVVATDAPSNGWQPDRVDLINQVGNYVDARARYGVFCKETPNESARGDRDISSVFAHSVGANLLKGQGRMKAVPFWLRSGFGYYVEHILFDRCQVHYLDFNKYYEDKADEITKGEILGKEDDWPSVLKKMCKKGERSRFDEVMTSAILTLSPKESGYNFALVYFLVRDDAARENFGKVIAALREGAAFDRKMILDAYGYEDEASLETEWYEWMQSKEFK